MGKTPWLIFLLMDRAYEGDETRELAVELGYAPVVPPNPGRVNPWEYDKPLYKRRNEVERCIRRIKAHRRIFTRYDKLDVMFLGFIILACAVEFLRLC
jgi:transposase